MAGGVPPEPRPDRLGQLPEHGHHADRGTFHRPAHQHLRVPPDGHHRRAAELPGLGAERLRRQRALPLHYFRSGSWPRQRDGLPARGGDGGKVFSEETRAGAGPEHHRDRLRHLPDDPAAQVPVRGVRVAERHVHPGGRVPQPVRVRGAPAAPLPGGGRAAPGRGGPPHPRGPLRRVPGVRGPAGRNGGHGQGGRGRGRPWGAPGAPRGPGPGPRGAAEGCAGAAGAEDGGQAHRAGPAGLLGLVLGLLRGRLALHQSDVRGLRFLGSVRLQQLRHPVHPPPGNSQPVQPVRAKRRFPSDFDYSHTPHLREGGARCRGRPALHQRLERLPAGQLQLGPLHLYLALAAHLRRPGGHLRADRVFQRLFLPHARGDRGPGGHRTPGQCLRHHHWRQRHLRAAGAALRRLDLRHHTKIRLFLLYMWFALHGRNTLFAHSTLHSDYRAVQKKILGWCPSLVPCESPSGLVRGTQACLAWSLGGAWALLGRYLLGCVACNVTVTASNSTASQPLWESQCWKILRTTCSWEGSDYCLLNNWFKCSYQNSSFVGGGGAFL